MKMFNMKYSEMKEENFRKKITFLSFVSAAVVVLIHAYYVFDYSPAGFDIGMFFPTKIAFCLNKIGYTYAVQFFFILSGFLLFRNMNEKNIKRKLKSRFLSLVVPYVLWNIFYIIFWLIASCLGVTDTVVDLNPVALILGIVTHKYFSTFWFMGNLIVYVAVSPVIYLLSKRTEGVIILDIVTLIYHCIAKANLFGMHFDYYSIVCSDWFLFFLFGINVAIFFPNLLKTEMDIKCKKIIFFVGLLCLTALLWIVEKFWLLEIVLTFGTIIHIIVLGGNCIKWETFHLQFWMKKSFVIYAWHGMICSFVSKVVYKVLPDQYFTEVVAYLSYIFIGVAIIILLDEVAKRTVPHFRQFFLGRRDS